VNLCQVIADLVLFFLHFCSFCSPVSLFRQHQWAFTSSKHQWWASIRSLLASYYFAFISIVSVLQLAYSDSTSEPLLLASTSGFLQFLQALFRQTHRSVISSLDRPVIFISIVFVLDIVCIWHSTCSKIFPWQTCNLLPRHAHAQNPSSPLLSNRYFLLLSDTVTAIFSKRNIVQITSFH
jgi:hypothetical protein